MPLAAGELLAAFEMFELGDSSRPLPPLPPIKTECGPSTGPIMPIPPEIRPTLVKYRWTITTMCSVGTTVINTFNIFQV